MVSNNIPDLSIEKIDKYNMRVPRYTSYPTVPNWEKEMFGHEEYLQSLHEISDVSEPISLYFHIPFCERRCLFCACNTIITQRPERSERYLSYLKKEMKKVSSILGENRKVIQIHLGGGTPTHFNPDQLEELFEFTESVFSIRSDAERSIEVHPSVTSLKQIELLSDYHFNRLSLGVQDFDPVVQKKLNRHQTYEETKELIDFARHLGFESINVDLIYGLPYQTDVGLDKTIDQVLTLKPERIALYSYAHFPSIFTHHKGIPLEVLPSGNSKMQLFLDSRSKLLHNEYEQVGFDHFTLKSDELWKSYADKTLRRNFMGYTTKTGTDLIAFGWSGISELSNAYAQNTKDITQYKELIDKYGVAVVKGHRMKTEDKVRKQLIMDILCQGNINITRMEDDLGHQLNFIREEANTKLPDLVNSGFVVATDDGWSLTAEGQIFARVVAASFDEFFSNEHLFSRSV